MYGYIGPKPAQEAQTTSATPIRYNATFNSATKHDDILQSSPETNVEFAELLNSIRNLSDLARKISDPLARLNGRHFKKAAADHFCRSVFELEGPNRASAVVYARHVAWYLTRRVLCTSFPAIGRLYGNRDHSSVIHGYYKIEHTLPTERGQQLRLDAYMILELIRKQLCDHLAK